VAVAQERVMSESPTQRIVNLRQRVLNSPPEIFAERAEIITESYRNSHGKPAVIRHALALRDMLAKIPIHIAPDELIVGNFTPKPRGCQVFPEYDMGFIIQDLDEIEYRKADRFIIEEENKEKLQKIYEYWKYNSFTDNALGIISEEQTHCMSDLVFVLTALRSGIGHVIVDYQACLERGVRGILQDIDVQRSKLDPHDREYAGKLIYHTAARISGESIIAFSNRFASLADVQAQEEQDPVRKSELLGIAATCRKVPEHPAGTFQEALQSFWMLHLVLHLENNGHSISPGRFDQYMYPYYDADIQASVSKEELEEYLHALWIKFFELNKVRDTISSVAFSGYPMFQNLILGGLDQHGKSSVNPLSHLCLDATAKIKFPQPSLSIRWHFGCPESFVNHVFDVVSLGTGMPALFNDEVLIPNMLNMGYTLDEARNYAIVGCTETVSPAVGQPWLTGGFLNALKILELTIFNGKDPISGTQHIKQTGNVEEMASFGDFLNAYERQLAYYLEQNIIADNILDSLHGTLCPLPFESLFIHDCAENGKTSQEGGARYNSTTLEVVGLPNVIDSLAVIDTLVYREKNVSWPHMKKMLLDDWEGSESFRLSLRENYPKYGNDIEYVDGFGRELVDFLYEAIKPWRSPRGGEYRFALYSVSSHILFARKTGATPDGRKKYDVLADGGISCAQGRDKQGLTALLNSIVQLDPYKPLGSTLLNVKISPSLFLGENRKKLVDAIKTYFMKKGQHIQFNVVDVKTLREAQKHPENFPSLMVRVAGFSALFTSLDYQLQEDIIARTEHSSGF
jgi:formate C-acetyltransferase